MENMTIQDEDYRSPLGYSEEKLMIQKTSSAVMESIAARNVMRGDSVLDTIHTELDDGEQEEITTVESLGKINFW